MSIKNYLRSDLKVRRHEFFAGLSRAELTLIQHEFIQRVFALPSFSPLPQVVGCYYAVREEVPTAYLIDELIKRRVQVCLPHAHLDLSITFHLYHKESKLELSPFKIPQPLSTSPHFFPDILIVPILGFKQDGHRIGYGRGYYDRALRAARIQKSITAIGLAFDCQEVSDNFAEEFDEPLDWIVTQSRIIRNPNVPGIVPV